jgi:hypothetical protein
MLPYNKIYAQTVYHKMGAIAIGKRKKQTFFEKKIARFAEIGTETFIFGSANPSLSMRFLRF